MVFSVIVTNVFVKYFSSHLARIVGLIDNFLQNEMIPEEFLSQSTSSVLEFQKFEDFVGKAFTAIQNRIQEVKTLAGSISHEIRTPLTAINITRNLAEETLASLSEKMFEYGDYESKYAENIERLGNELYSIGDAVKSAALTTDLILSNLRNENIRNRKFKELSIIATVNDALKHYPFTAKEYSLVHWENNNDFQYCGDPGLSKLVLFNLLKNALYYIHIEGHGEIFIETKNTEQEHQLIFKDTSAGVSPHILPHIFERFFSGRKGGIGLGLSFCKIVMQSYGGDITCESDYGKFTKFILSFPVIK